MMKIHHNMIIVPYDKPFDTKIRNHYLKWKKLLI